MFKYNSVNKVVLTYISALVRFLCKIVTSVHGYEQDKVSYKMIRYTLMYVCYKRKYNRINMVIGSIFFCNVAVKCDKSVYIYSAHVIHTTGVK